MTAMLLLRSETDYEEFIWSAVVLPPELTGRSERDSSGEGGKQGQVEALRRNLRKMIVWGYSQALLHSNYTAGSYKWVNVLGSCI